MMLSPTTSATRTFDFQRDTFAYPNELVWQYRIDPATGAVSTFRTEPPPQYYQRCFVMVRATRQFFHHARFEPRLPQVDIGRYREWTRQVISRNPRAQCAESERIAIPGFTGLREFSTAHDKLLKAECGGRWDGYFLRSHWRMVFPIWHRHQEHMALQLQQSLRTRTLTLIHLFRFPDLSINHGIVLFGCTETPVGVEFDAYDPNIPEHPTRLTFDRARRWFDYPRAHYWRGGTLSVIEVFRGGLY